MAVPVAAGAAPSASASRQSARAEHDRHQQHNNQQKKTGEATAAREFIARTRARVRKSIRKRDHAWCNRVPGSNCNGNCARKLWMTELVVAAAAAAAAAARKKLPHLELPLLWPQSACSPPTAPPPLRAQELPAKTRCLEEVFVMIIDMWL